MAIEYNPTPLLNALRLACAKDRLESLFDRCAQISSALSGSCLPYTYAGFYLAKQGRLSDSLLMLQSRSEDCFTVALRSHLLKAGSMKVIPNIFKNTRPLEIWTNTSFARKEQMCYVKAIIEFTKRRPGRPHSRNPTIIDIGSGTAELLCQLLKMLTRSHQLTGVNLVLIDSSKEMLKAAQRRCSSELTMPVNITPICMPIQNVSMQQLHGLARLRPWFAVSTVTLHHLNRIEKKRILKNWAHVCPNLFLGEQDADHDIPAPHSFALFNSVQNFYGSLIQQVKKSKVSRADKDLCVRQFLLAEAIKILGSSYRDRGDYHTNLKHWQQIAGKAGFRLQDIKTCRAANTGPTSFLMWLKSTKLSDRVAPAHTISI